MVNRRMPRPRASAGASRRAAPHPGISGGGAAAPAFTSPFQPTDYPGLADFLADASPDSWRTILAGGRAWRARRLNAAAVSDLVLSQTKYSRDSKVRNAAKLALIRDHIHPEDLVELIEELMDPDSALALDDLAELIKGIATLGTARPFVPAGNSPPSPSPTGAPSGRDFWAAASPTRSDPSDHWPPSWITSSTW